MDLRGEKKMWAAVLVLAINDLIKPICVEKKNIDRVKSETGDWFQSQQEGIGSLLWICDVLEISSDYVRNSIAALKAKKPAIIKPTC